jgi:type I restriction enzyme S subunit
MSTTAKQLEMEDDPKTGEDLPEGWVEALLTEISAEAKFSIVDGPFGSDLKLSDYVDGGAVPVLTTRNLTGTYDPASVRFISLKKFQQLQRSKVVGGDILIAKIGSVGRCSIYPDNAPTAIIPANLCKITVSPAVVYNRFLYWQIRGDEFQQKLIGITSATAQPAFSVKRLKTLSARTAPYAEQHRIVKMIEQSLRQVDGATDRLSRVQQILRHFRKAVLAAACSGKLTNDWRKQNLGLTLVEDTIREIRTRRHELWKRNHGSTRGYEPPRNVEADALGDLPDQWEYVSSDCLFSFVTSGSRGWAKYYSDSGPLFLRVGNLDHDSIALDFSDVQHVKPLEGLEGERTRVEKGDILISITADVGMIGLVSEELGTAYVNQHVSLARPVGIADSRYLAWFLTSSVGQLQFEALQRGATKVGLGLDDIRSVAVPFPPLEEQYEIVRRIEAFFKLADAIEKRVAAATLRAERLTQAVLAKAFRGELVPTEAELARREGREYEPASVLLERIRLEREKNEATVKRGKVVRKALSSKY